MTNRYIFDLDNTLVYTDCLNCEAYQYALTEMKLIPINTCVRLTREVVFDHYPFLSVQQKERIIEIKQRYFLEKIEHTTPNMCLINLLKSLPDEHCILWTSADKDRTYAILRYYEIEAEFKGIYFTSKKDLSSDIKALCNALVCDREQLVFFEDNTKIGDSLTLLGIRVELCTPAA